MTDLETIYAVLALPAQTIIASDHGDVTRIDIVRPDAETTIIRRRTVPSGSSIDLLLDNPTPQAATIVAPTPQIETITAQPAPNAKRGRGRPVTHGYSNRAEPTPCPECGKVLRAMNIPRHLEESCPNVPATKFRRHAEVNMDRGKGPRKPCPYCPLPITVTNFGRHLTRCHQDQLPHACPECPLRFMTPRALASHHTQAHPDAAPLRKAPAPPRKRNAPTDPRPEQTPPDPTTPPAPAAPERPSVLLRSTEATAKSPRKGRSNGSGAILARKTTTGRQRVLKALSAL